MRLINLECALCKHKMMQHNWKTGLIRGLTADRAHEVIGFIDLSIYITEDSILYYDSVNKFK